MKKLRYIAAAVALASPIVLAANTPEIVGEVTYSGNISANPSMWQWTVNDYPGGRLDAKPNTGGGNTIYQLKGSPYIAVSGYLPSYIPAPQNGPPSNLGVREITSIVDSAGAPPGTVKSMGRGEVTFSIAANGFTNLGSPVRGTLKIAATELRGYRFAREAVLGRTVDKGTVLLGDNNLRPPIGGGSCFVGTGKYTHSLTAVISGTADVPVKGEQSQVAWEGWIQALAKADATGVLRYDSIKRVIKNNAWALDRNCDVATVHFGVGSDGKEYTYIAAAHVLEVTPVSVSFPEPILGAWEATMTVTTAQM